ncbi:MAG TPA: type IX secretion system membrane protein PorP/SprF [Tenuifilaceae bacterium]|nr:type IX secretion system membrane protein PorP/SprF [Tenuifilaceae bacterium]
MKRKIYILLVFTLLTGVALAQQQPIYSQYMMNTYLLNPAVAGYQGITDLNLTAREQWLGYGEGPSTYAFSAQTRILKTSFRNRSRLIKNRVRRRRPSGRVGLGGYVFNDMNGRIRRTGFQGTYAYHIYLRETQLSFGASLSAFQFKADVTPDDLPNPLADDPLVIMGKANADLSPDANFGVLVSGDKYYAGISVTSLFQSSIQFGLGNSQSAYRLLRHYYILGGYKFQERRSDFGVEPSAMITLTERLSWSIDLNVKGYYKQDYWVGLSFRTTGTIITMLGMNYQQFYFGYAFDYSYGDITSFNNMGSHELMIGMRLGDSARRYRWLNRF